MTMVSESHLKPMVEGDSVLFSREDCQRLGDELHNTYVNNQPFPHIVIENFLPTDQLRRVVAEFPERQIGRFNDDQSKLKTGYQLEMIKSSYITNYLSALNSSQFISFLERLSGIKGLIPDPHFAGGGLHETARGGHLSIHADFNIHPTLKLRRRMNAILFLNENWQTEYSGALELWDKDMTACQHAVLPEIGTLVVFNTEADSLHGHPDPLNAPDETYRRSMALYYYTAPDTNIKEVQRTTDFKRRPDTKDKIAFSTKFREIARDITPPFLDRMLRGKE